MLRKILITFFLFLISGIFTHAQPLDFYIQKGLANSPLLKDFRNQMILGKLDSLLTLANYKPQISQVSRAMYAPVAKKYGYEEAITDGGNYSAVVSLEQSLFNQKAKEIQFKTISFFTQTIEADSEITAVELRQGITAQYLSAYADYLQIAFNQTALNLLKDEQSIMKSLVDRGLYVQTDLMNLSLAITAQKIAVQQSDLQYRSGLSVLYFLCGITDTSSALLEKPELTLRNSFNISNSPVMMKFKIDSLKNLNAKQSIDLNYRPKLSAFADLGFMSIRPENVLHNFGTSFGLNFTLPIYDGKQRKLQYAKTSLAENSRMGYKAFYTSQYTQQVNQLTEQLNLTGELIMNIRNQLSEQETIIALYKIEIEKGLVRFLDFLNAVNNYTQTKNSLTISEMNRLQIINQMNYLK